MVGKPAKATVAPVVFVYCFIFVVPLCCGQRLVSESDGFRVGWASDCQLNLIMKIPRIALGMDTRA